MSLYFEFFNPSYLFMSGGVKIVSSTRTAGVFLLPLAVLIPIGIYQLVRYRKDAWSAVVVAGFATAPIAAVLISEHGAVERELELIPFGVLLAASGLQWLWGRRCALDSFRPPSLWQSAGSCSASRTRRGRSRTAAG